MGPYRAILAQAKMAGFRSNRRFSRVSSESSLSYFVVSVGSNSSWTRCHGPGKATGAIAPFSSQRRCDCNAGGATDAGLTRSSMSTVAEVAAKEKATAINAEQCHQTPKVLQESPASPTASAITLRAAETRAELCHLLTIVQQRNHHQ